MAALPDLITVQQFRRMPDDGRAYELHHGEVVALTRPKAKHYNLQGGSSASWRTDWLASGRSAWSFPIVRLRSSICGLPT
jgi:hypothetical protein